MIILLTCHTWLVLRITLQSLFSFDLFVIYFVRAIKSETWLAAGVMKMGKRGRTNRCYEKRAKHRKGSEEGLFNRTVQNTCWCNAVSASLAYNRGVSDVCRCPGRDDSASVALYSLTWPLAMSAGVQGRDDSASVALHSLTWPSAMSSGGFVVGSSTNMLARTVDWIWSPFLWHQWRKLLDLVTVYSSPQWCQRVAVIL